MRDDPGSTLSFTRRLIELRRELPELRSGSYSSLDGGPGVWAWRRGERGRGRGEPLGAPAPAPGRGRDDPARHRGWSALGERAAGGLRLDPWEAAILLD